jgi:hypothetical protein
MSKKRKGNKESKKISTMTLKERRQAKRKQKERRNKERSGNKSILPV